MRLATVTKQFILSAWTPEQFLRAWREGDLRLHLLFLLVLSAGLWVPTCGLWDLWGADEGRYVQVAKELLERHNWFLLTVHGQPYDQKPPLAFWIFAMMLKLTGGEISNWAVRLPSVLSAVLVILLTYGIGRQKFGHRAGLKAALVLLTTPLILSHAPEARLDMLFAGSITLSLFAWLTRREGQTLTIPRALLMWGALAGAFFIKGPLAIFIVLSVLLAESLSIRSWQKIATQSRFIIGLTIVLLLIGGWFVVEFHSVSEDFVDNQIKGETIHRFLHSSHEQPFWYYFPKLFTAILMPWAAILIPVGIRIWKERRSLPAGVIPLLSWFLPPFLLLCIASGKRQGYMVPLMPPIALLVGRELNFWTQSNRRLPRLSRLFGLVFLALSVAECTVAITLIFQFDMPWKTQLHLLPHDLVFIGFAVLVQTALAWKLFRCSRSGSFLFYVVVTVILLTAALELIALRPALNSQRSHRLFAENLSEKFPTLKTGGVLGAFDKADKSKYHVYGSYRVIPIAEGAASLATPNQMPVMLIALRQDVEKLSDALTNAGYREFYSDTPTGDELVLFSRKVPGEHESRGAAQSLKKASR